MVESGASITVGGSVDWFKLEVFKSTDEFSSERLKGNTECDCYCLVAFFGKQILVEVQIVKSLLTIASTVGAPY